MFSCYYVRKLKIIQSEIKNAEKQLAEFALPEYALPLCEKEFIKDLLSIMNGAHPPAFLYYHYRESYKDYLRDLGKYLISIVHYSDKWQALHDKLDELKQQEEQLKHKIGIN